jgi:hypothetical protein
MSISPYRKDHMRLLVSVVVLSLVCTSAGVALAGASARTDGKTHACGSFYRQATNRSADYTGTHLRVSAKNIACRMARRYGIRLLDESRTPAGYSCTGNTRITCRRGVRQAVFGIRTDWR